MREGLSPTRVNVARILAVAADCVQLMVFPAFIEGAFSLADDVLDVIVAGAMFGLLGWHWAFLPGFLAELIPGVNLVPTWTAAVFIATGFGPLTTARTGSAPIDVTAKPVAPTEPPSFPPVLPPKS